MPTLTDSANGSSLKIKAGVVISAIAALAGAVWYLMSCNMASATALSVRNEKLQEALLGAQLKTVQVQLQTVHVLENIEAGQRQNFSAVHAEHAEMLARLQKGRK